MMEVPSTPWRAKSWTLAEAVTEAPGQDGRGLAWKLLPGGVSHTFTHFHLELQVVASDLPARLAMSDEEVSWVPVTRLDEAGLPSVMAKIARHALQYLD
jgi:A/G-specific adenine glycosylase